MKNYLRKEYSQICYRTIFFTANVVVFQTKAKLSDDVLYITLSKLKPTKIQSKKSIFAVFFYLTI